MRTISTAFCINFQLPQPIDYLDYLFIRRVNNQLLNVAFRPRVSPQLPQPDVEVCLQVNNAVR